MSLINFGAGLSAMGSAISTFAGNAAMAEQKAELEKQQAILADQLATTRETALTHVRGEEDRTTGAANAAVQGDQQIKVGAANAEATGAQQRNTDAAKNKLPISATEQAQLDAAKALHEKEGWETLQDSDGNSYRINSGRGISQKQDKDGNWIDQPSIPSALHKVGSPDQGSFTPEMGNLMGALAERDVNLPAGLRSRAQQVTLLKGLLDRNPGMSADEIADQVKSGKLQMVADTKQAQTVGSITGQIKYAEEELPLALDTARAAIGKVPTSGFLPLSKLVAMGDANISDPNQRELKIKLMSALQAYEMLSKRAGTDKDKRDKIESMLMTADTPEVLNKAIDSFEVEAVNAKVAAKRAMTFDTKNGPKSDATPADATTAPVKTGTPKPGAYSWTPNGGLTPQGQQPPEVPH